jgi:glycosyltransferase involved in cell wall biosynthesis
MTGCHDANARRVVLTDTDDDSAYAEPTTPSASRPLRVLHLSTVGNAGGAGRASFRLHQSLLRLGHDSRILTGRPVGLAPGIEHLGAVPPKLNSRLNEMMTRIGGVLDQLPVLDRWAWRDSWRIAELDAFRRADVVNLHNLHGGYFNIRALEYLAQYKPLVWTLHDMWALTGHCAYSYDCGRWQEGCHTCPLLRGEGRRLVEPAPTLLDRTRSTWNTKRRIYRAARLHVIAPSLWLEGLVRRSILASAVSVQHIPYGIDLERFRPIDQAAARRDLNLPTDARIVFFSSDNVQNQRKGRQYLFQALRQIRRPDATWLLMTGKGPTVSDGLHQVHVRSLGYLEDELSQRRAISAADVCVSPTLADNAPLLLVESLACGVPIVAFDVDGVGEIVRHLETGYLARRRDLDDLARGIDLLLDDDALRRRLIQRCRQVAEAEYSSEASARRYSRLYEQAVHAHQMGACRA